MKRLPPVALIVAAFLLSRSAASQVQYFGYAYGAGFDVTRQDVDKETTSDLPITSLFTNFSMTDGIYRVDRDYSNFQNRLNTMHAYNLKAMVDLGKVLWCDPSLTNNYYLCPDYQSRWSQWISDNSSVLTPANVLAFKIIDEPFQRGLPVADVNAAAAVVKKSFPGTPTVIIDSAQAVACRDDYEQCQFLREAGQLRKIDWFGLDKYAIHPKTDPEFIRGMNHLRAKFGGRLIYVLDGTWTDQPPYTSVAPSVSDMAAIAQEWYEVANCDPRAILLGVFLWAPSGSPPHSYSSRDFPSNVLQVHRRIGSIISHGLPVLEGFHDSADCNTISGWAWNRQNPWQTMSVDIYDGGTRIATVPANAYRGDLVAASICPGTHGFSFSTPASLRDGRPHSIDVKFAGTSIDLQTTPRTLRCTPPSVSIAWIQPSNVTWGPPNTLTVAGYAQNGSGTVQLFWRDLTEFAGGGWNVVSYLATPDANGVWYNTIPSGFSCHSYEAYTVYSGIQSPVYAGYTTAFATSHGWCNEAVRVIWIQPQYTAGFGPPGSLIVAGSASGAPAGAGVQMYWADLTNWSGWQLFPWAPPPDGSGIWYNSIPNVDFSHQYAVYAVNDAVTSPVCGYGGNGTINWCP